MVLIDMEEWRLRRLREQAEGQKAALGYLREEVAGAGFETAARLLALAVLAIDDAVKDLPGPRPPEDGR